VYSVREGKPYRLQVFLGADTLKVAWESDITISTGAPVIAFYEGQFFKKIDRNKVVPRVM